MTELHKKRISESMKGKVSPNKGKTMSENQKNKLRISHLKRIKERGIIFIKQQVKVRDDYTCQICGLRDIEIMQVDHIKPKSIYPDLAKCFENLVCLCPNCHSRKTLRDKKLIMEFKK